MRRKKSYYDEYGTGKRRTRRWGLRTGSSRRDGSRSSRGSRGSHRGGERSSRRFSAIDWIALVLSAVLAVAVGLSWLARWINPAAYGFMSSAGLFMPVLYVANFLFVLYWIIRWRWGVAVSLAVFVAGLWGVSMFFRPQFTREHGDMRQGRSQVTIATYNVQGMMRRVEGSSTRLRSSMREVVEVVDSLRADVLCVQEFRSTAAHPRSRFDEALPGYIYSRVRYNISGNTPAEGWGNAIYSKFPIIESGHVDFEGTSNSILWADIAVRRDTIRVFNAHLQTTAIKASDEQYIVDMDFVGDSTRNSRVKGLVGKLTRNYIIRAGQAERLAEKIAASPYPVVVCGDFNDTPMSYSYRKISKRLKDSFCEAGQGYGYTYRGFFNLLRIDYILHSRSMECTRYSSPSFDNSDHNPVTVRLTFDNR